MILRTKILLLLLILISITKNVSSQTDPRVLEIREKFKKINDSKNYRVISLNNQEFMEDITDGGGELTAYMRNDSIFRINVWIGLSNRNLIYELYYWGNELVFVYEIEDSHKIIYEDGEFIGFDHFNTQVTLEGRYYFNKNKMFKKIIKGEYLMDEIQPDSVIEKELTEMSIKYFEIVRNK